MDGGNHRPYPTRRPALPLDKTGTPPAPAIHLPPVVLRPPPHDEDKSAAARWVSRPVEAYHVDDMHRVDATVYAAE